MAIWIGAAGVVALAAVIDLGRAPPGAPIPAAAHCEEVTFPEVARDTKEIADPVRTYGPRVDLDEMLRSTDPATLKAARKFAPQIATREAIVAYRGAVERCSKMEWRAKLAERSVGIKVHVSGGRADRVDFDPPSLDAAAEEACIRAEILALDVRPQTPESVSFDVRLH
jgi:hypothetical protein